MADEKNYMQALRTFVMDETALDRVFVGGVPKGKITDANPAKAVTMNRSGGLALYGQRDNMTIAQQRFDLICYGQTRFEADAVLRKVAAVLRGLVRQVVDDVLLIRIVKAGGVLSLIDDDTDLPIEVQSFELIAEI